MSSTDLIMGSAGSSTAALPDPNFKNVSLLLSGDGTNGSQNNTFVAANYAAASALGGYSGYFNGSSGLTTPYNSNWILNTDFTIEGWIFPTDTGTSRAIIGTGDSGGNPGWDIQWTSTNTISSRWINTGGTVFTIASNALSANTWHHFALTLNGTTLTLYVNGTSAATATISGSARTTNYTLGIGQFGAYTAGQQFIGYTSNIRYVKGSVVYTGNFTPATTPLTAITNTQLLTCQSPTFVDNSSNNFTLTVNGNATVATATNSGMTITRNGNTTQGSFSPYGSNWGNYFNGSSYLSAPADASSNFGTGQFCVEAWFNQSVSSFAAILAKWEGGDNWLLATDGSLGLQFYYNGGSITGGSYTLGTWNHVAVTRDGSNVIRLFLNGTQVATVTSSFNSSTTSAVTIGNYSTNNKLTGYISNARIVKGSAVYTTAFTPSTTPLTAISGTSLLTCQSNRFIDNSSNAFAITVTGTPSVQRFSPFNPTSTNSTSVIGGSGYFDGTGDYLTLPAGSTDFIHQGTTDWTIECWFNTPLYNTSAPGGYGSLFSTTGNSGAIGFNVAINSNNAGDVTFSISNGVSAGAYSMSTAGGLWNTNTWNHIALTFNSTTKTGKIYLNGISRTLTTAGNGSFSGSTASNVPAIGRLQVALESQRYPYTGLISDIRVVNSIVYTTNFTPPATPVTAVSGTQLLTNFTNAGIPDLAMMNNLETVGNAQVSTSVKKYGTGSLYYPSSGTNYIVAPPNTAHNFGTGDFTIEMWCYMTSVAGYQFPIDLRTGSGFQPAICIGNNDGTMYFTINNTTDAIAVSGVFTTNAWHHVAICRSGTSTKMFLDGVQRGSTYTDTNNYTSGSAYLGTNALSPTTSNYVYRGYIDDVRITKGLARYTANFTPPALALPNQ